MNLTIKDKKLLYKGKFTKLWATYFLDKAGKEQIWEWLQRKDYIVVFPITHDGKVVLIKNFRIPMECYVMEMPAGLLDQEGESEIDAAKRELLEETGYEAEEVIPITKFAAAAGTSNNLIHAFIATGCHKISDKCGDETEDMTVVEIAGESLIDNCLNPPDGVLFNMTTMGMYEVAKAKGLIK
jgi:ADP-ribose pyrophosphatase